MVGVLPPRKNLGAQFGQAVGAGIPVGVEGALQAQQKQKRLADIMNLAFGQPAQGQSQPVQPQAGNLGDQYQSVLQGQMQPQGASALNPQQLTALFSEDPELAKFLQSQQQEQKKLSQEHGSEKEKVRQFGHTKTEKYADKLAEDSRQGEEMKYGVKLIRDAMRSGKTGPTARNLSQKYLESVKSPLADLFASPESGKVNIGIKTLASGFKQIMGSKPTEREFFWYENILPSLVKNIQTNEAIVDYFDKVSDFSLKAQEIADDIVRENSGYRPIDLDVKVRQQMKPLFNEMINEGMGLLAETESPSKKGSQSEHRVFTEMPDASAYSGKVLRDPDSNKRYRSDGKSWIEIK